MQHNQQGHGILHYKLKEKIQNCAAVKYIWVQTLITHLQIWPQKQNDSETEWLRYAGQNYEMRAEIGRELNAPQ